MNFRPLLGLYWKHGTQIEALFSGASTDQGNVLVDFLTAAAPVVNKHWPALNQNALIDDTVAALKEAFAPQTTPPMSGGLEGQ
jgi:hypothetical protein